MARCGGQRTWTAMVFLNARGRRPDRVRRGGNQGHARTGNLLTWNNLDALGEPQSQLHAFGLPVTAGVKYVITKWYRERPWFYTDTRSTDPSPRDSPRKNWHSAVLRHCRHCLAVLFRPYTISRNPAMNRAALLAAAALLITALPPASASAQAPAAAAQVRRRRSRMRIRGCTSCSTTATRRASDATRSRQCSAATSATPIIWATISATHISRPRKPRLEQDLATLASIDRNALTPTDQLAYDVFTFQREDDLIDYQPE
jgi:hypothetical protein